MKTNKKTKVDVYQKITDKVISAIEKGKVKDWIKPWAGTGEGFPSNHTTKKAYRGINTMLLLMEADEKGYTSSQWLTFKQAKAVGGSVKRGEKGTQIVFFSPIEKENKKGENEKFFILRQYTVFNLEQTDIEIKVVKPLPEFRPIKKAENYFANIKHKVKFSGGRAFYCLKTDSVTLPFKNSFDSKEDLYSAWGHEVGHWTGSPVRLKRDFSGRFGSEAYAFEELVAELTSAFLCSKLGIKGKMQHTEYINSWLKVLKGDKKAIFTASSHAQKAVDFLDSFQEEAVNVA